jgi:hypothetical protein
MTTLSSAVMFDPCMRAIYAFVRIRGLGGHTCRVTYDRPLAERRVLELEHSDERTI